MFDDRELMRIHLATHPDEKYPPVGGWPDRQKVRGTDVTGLTETEHEVLRMQAHAHQRDGNNAFPLFGGQRIGQNVDHREMTIGDMVQHLQRNGYKVTKRKR